MRSRQLCSRSCWAEIAILSAAMIGAVKAGIVTPSVVEIVVEIVVTTATAIGELFPVSIAPLPRPRRGPHR
eukprot:3767217-Pyramimonas_sp.AAC.1